ncbi:MAG: hypothetical protein ACOC4J_00370 [Bacteroidota bacterium]
MSYYRVKSLWEFRKLKPNKKKWSKENTEWDYGKPYVLYSPYSKKRFDKVFNEYMNKKLLQQYILHGNIYLEKL